MIHEKFYKSSKGQSDSFIIYLKNIKTRILCNLTIKDHTISIVTGLALKTLGKYKVISIILLSVIF